MRKFLIATIILFLVFIGLLIAIRANNRHTTLNPDLEATLSVYPQEDVKSANIINIRINNGRVELQVFFQGGGGDNKKAKLSVVTKGDKKVLRINLINTDNISQKMLVLYELKGVITNVTPGNYVLEVVDSKGYKVSEKSFEIK